MHRPGGLQHTLRFGIPLAALVSALAVTGGASGAPEGGAESCLSQRQRPCGFNYDITWEMTWRFRKAPAPDLNSNGTLRVTFPRVRISGGDYQGRVQMSSQTQTPRLMGMKIEFCEAAEVVYRRPVTLTVTAGRSTFFAGFRPDRTFNPLLACEGTSPVPLSSATQWDVGCTRRDNVVWNCRTTQSKGAEGMLHGGAAFEGTSTTLYKTRSRLPFPLDRLWTGRSFVISGQTTKTAKFLPGASMYTSVRLTFTRRR